MTTYPVAGYVIFVLSACAGETERQRHLAILLGGKYQREPNSLEVVKLILL